MLDLIRNQENPNKVHMRHSLTHTRCQKQPEGARCFEFSRALWWSLLVQTPGTFLYTVQLANLLL